MNPDRLQHLLHSCASARVAVIGDVMLDRFIWGRVSRISPEAPVPVVEVTGESSYPGGAANVARNLRAFCREVEIFGAIGQDAYGSELRDLLETGEIHTGGLIALEDYSTIVKTRIVARQQQVVRVDRERKTPLPKELLQKLLTRLEEALTSTDAVILEDYGKGLLNQELHDAVCRLAAGKVITVDPNPGNPLNWKGAVTVKPNRGEAFAAAGIPLTEPNDDPLQDAPLARVGETLLEKWKVPQLLITLGEHGMILFRTGQPPYHTPTRAQEVYDVSGAGDTAIALYTLALAAGASPEEAAELSNHASGIVVGKLGTATLTPAELKASISESHG